MVLAGGTESMSQAPHVVRGARWGLRLGPAAPLEDTLWEALRDAYCGLSMAETAEKLAERYRHRSRRRWTATPRGARRCAKAAWEAGAFADEVVPVTLKDRKTRQDVAWAADEHMRPGHHRRGAGQAAALLQEGRRRHRRERVGHLRRRGRAGAGRRGASRASAGCARSAGWSAWGVAGVDPSIMGIGPGARLAPGAGARGARARRHGPGRGQRGVRRAVPGGRAGARASTASAPTWTAAPWRWATRSAPAARASPLHLLHALRRRGGRYGLGAACIGGGQGAAVVVEALPA